MLNKSDPPADKKEPVVIKKYANRRLYNTETSTYVTLDDLAAMVKGERDFVVFDAKTGDDLTHSVLTQIIVDQEHQKGTETLLPIPFLRQLIRFYGASIERFVPSYLQISLETLAKEQDRYRKQFTGAFTPAGAFEAYQEQARKNLAMFEQAMAMFSPFGAIKVGAGAKPGEEGKKPEQLKSLDKPAEKISGSSGAQASEIAERSALDACGALANQSAPPMERSRRATLMPMVKPATTSISEATMIRKNTEVAAWFTTRNSTMQATNTIIDKP
jgi:polyhydroxyalkanoate synthesis repressor PhaR